jgi:hypothetical protein
MPKLFKPSRENRDQAIQKIWTRFKPNHESLLEHAASKFEDLEIGLGKAKAGSDIFDIGRYANAELALAIDALWNNDNKAAGEHYSRSFKFIHQYVSYAAQRRQKEGWTYEGSEDAFNVLIDWQGLSQFFGQGWFCAWVAPYLNSLFESGSISFSSLLYINDPEGYGFMALLQKTIVSKAWPSTGEISHLGPFKALFENADASAEVFSQTLVDYCDYRISRNFGYPSIEVDDKDRSRSWQTIFGQTGICFELMPVELFTFAHAYHAATGKQVSLQGEHPMLQTPLMRVPAPVLEHPMHIPILEQCHTLMESYLGKDTDFFGPLPLVK